MVSFKKNQVILLFALGISLSCGEDEKSQKKKPESPSPKNEEKPFKPSLPKDWRGTEDFALSAFEVISE